MVLIVVVLLLLLLFEGLENGLLLYCFYFLTLKNCLFLLENWPTLRSLLFGFHRCRAFYFFKYVTIMMNLGIVNVR